MRPLEGLTAAEDWGPVGQVGNMRHAPCALQGTIQPRRAAFSSSIDALNCSCELAVNYYSDDSGVNITWHYVSFH